MMKNFLLNEEMRKYLVIYEKAVSHIWLCNRSLLNSSSMRKIWFSFLSVYKILGFYCIMTSKLHYFPCIPVSCNTIATFSQCQEKGRMSACHFVKKIQKYQLLFSHFLDPNENYNSHASNIWEKKNDKTYNNWWIIKASMTYLVFGYKIGWAGAKTI